MTLKDFEAGNNGKVIEELALGAIVGFQMENNQFKAEFGIGVTSEVILSPIYIGTVYADVNYKAGEFKLNNIRFEEIKG
ncbi:hypothetical protein D3C81_2191820 [compost metagenome]